MAIAVNCTSCKSKYQVRDNLAGRSIVCKECGQSISVPASQSDSADHSATDAYAVKGGAGKTPSPAAPQKSRSEPAERVLPRAVAPSPGHARPRGNQQMLWIFGGAALLLVFLVMLIVTSVGPPPVPADAIGKLGASPSSGNPPPAAPSADSGRPVARNASPDRSIARSAPKPGGTKSHVPAIEAPTYNTQEESASAREESTSEKREIAVVTDFDAWDVQVDPADEPFGIDSKKRIFATFPRNSARDVVYPDCPSLFVALGSNKNAVEIREVRDVQANRRVGSVRASVIFNARTALSPDGQFFAAWAAGQNRIGVWDVRAERPHGVVIAKESTSPRLLMFAGTERLIAAGDKDELLVWRMPDGQPERAIELPKMSASPVAGLTPGGRFLALATGDKKERFVRVFNLATGATAGEIKLEFHGERLPECRAVTFSPDGVELAILYVSAEETSLAVVRVASGKVVARIPIDETLQPAGRGAIARPSRALEWFPDRKRWLVYGRGIVERAQGKIVWWMPDDKEDVVCCRRVLDDRRLLTLGAEKNDPAIVVFELPDANVER
jgi:hypothetical protein